MCGRSSLLCNPLIGSISGMVGEDPVEGIDLGPTPSRHLYFLLHSYCWQGGQKILLIGTMMSTDRGCW